MEDQGERWYPSLESRRPRRVRRVLTAVLAVLVLAVVLWRLVEIADPPPGPHSGLGMAIAGTAAEPQATTGRSGDDRRP